LSTLLYLLTCSEPILLHASSSSGQLLKRVFKFRDALNADEQNLTQARLRSSGGNGADDWLLAIPFCP
jgi:hypothetical protein